MVWPTLGSRTAKEQEQDKFCYLGGMLSVDGDVGAAVRMGVSG